METLFILISWLLALVTWLPSGAYVLIKFGNPIKDQPVHRLIFALLLGAAITSGLVGAISLFSPISVLWPVSISIITAIVFRKSWIPVLLEAVSAIKKWPVLMLIGAALFFSITLLVSSLESLNNDSGLYYIQFVKWMNNYAVVPGLANLHDRFGFNSHWHLLTAAFNLHPFGQFEGNDLNGLLLFIFALGSLDSASRLTKEQDSFNLTWAVFPLPFYLLVRFLTSSAPDLPSTLIPLVYFSLLLKEKERSSLPILGCLLVFAATVKVLSVLHAIAFLPLLYWIVKRGDWKSIGSTIMLVSIILAPWIARNVVQTGYPVFPMESIDLIDVDWKVPNELAGNARKMVDTHARTGSYDLSKYGAPTSEWIGFWFSVQSKSVLGLLLFVLAGSFILVLADVFLIDRRKNSKQTILHLFLGLTVLASFAFWWKSGPNPRFIYGIVFFFFAYLLSLIGMQLRLAKWLRFAPLLALLPLLAITRTVLNEPAPKKPTNFSSFQIPDGTIFYPYGTDKCWNEALPCANMSRPDLRFRGEGFQDGFRNSELSE